ncbi:hypothetical protein Esti_000400 [Eimeria stiedai]
MSCAADCVSRFGPPVATTFPFWPDTDEVSQPRTCVSGSFTVTPQFELLLPQSLASCPTMLVAAPGGTPSPMAGDPSWGVEEEDALPRAIEDAQAYPLAEVFGSHGAQTQKNKYAPRGFLSAALWVVTVALVVCHVLFVWQLLVAASNGEIPDSEQSLEGLLPTGSESGGQPVSGTVEGMPGARP